jgi:hypothetical protein
MINFILNALFAYVPYAFGQTAPMKLWGFPSLSVNFAGTCIVEMFFNWLIMGFIMTFDVLNGVVAPIDPVKLVCWWPSVHSKINWWLNTSDLSIFGNIRTLYAHIYVSFLFHALFHTTII